MMERDRRIDAGTMHRRQRADEFAGALVLEDVSGRLRLRSTEIGSIYILCIAVQTMDEAPLADPMISMRMIVWGACADALELGDANPDLGEAEVVRKLDIAVGNRAHSLLWRMVCDQRRRADRPWGTSGRDAALGEAQAILAGLAREGLGLPRAARRDADAARAADDDAQVPLGQAQARTISRTASQIVNRRGGRP